MPNKARNPATATVQHKPSAPNDPKLPDTIPAIEEKRI